ncbi:3'-5' exoribonuclease csl4, putative, partial [Eimeria maxima]
MSIIRTPGELLGSAADYEAGEGITALNRMLAEVAVLAVDGHVLPEPFKGAIRAQDVRETVTEDFDMAECFQPSDVVRAEVLSVDGRVYLLGTAAEEFGVLCAD